MAMMLLAGIWALANLNKQFFPSFELDFVNVRVVWTGASAEDVESAITNPIEEELRTLDDLHKMFSTSAEGVSTVTLEYTEGTEMGEAIDKVKERVSLIRNLPPGAEEPEISRIVRYDPVASMLITGPDDLAQLRPLARRIERELLEYGIDRVSIKGLPKEELAIQVPSRTLRELDMSLPELADRVNRASQDIPAGVVGRDDVSRQLRALQQRRTEMDFERLPVISDGLGRRLTLADIGTIERRARKGQIEVTFRGRPAVEFTLQRTETGDSLEAAATFERWLKERKSSLPSGIELHVYDESWSLIRDRIELLVRNGAGGLILVVAILFMFLSGRVALWVAIGIPVSFMAALGVLSVLGGSINMISLFALIMTLGIIVDDAIVVGEDAQSHYSAGRSPSEAAEGGAFRMLAPVMSSSLTTIAAFLPLMLVGGVIGNILFDIPLIVVCVILASLVESFLVLPGHLRGAFATLERSTMSRLRARFDGAFGTFRDKVFRPAVTAAVGGTSITIALAVASLLLAVGLVAGKRVPFNFFPTPESSVLSAKVGFVAGTPPERVRAFMQHANDALDAAVATFDEPLLEVAVIRLGEHGQGRTRQTGDQFATLMVELVDSDKRSVRNSTFIDAWNERIILSPGVESFSISARRAGPPGRDVEVKLTGADAGTLKSAALELNRELLAVQGVRNVDDDMPFGPEQLIYDITPLGASLGLTVESIGRQLRAGYDGQVAQIYQDGDEEVEVRVMLSDNERHRLASLQDFAIVPPSGRAVPFSDVVSVTTRQGFETLRHTDGRLSVLVTADVDPAVTTSNEVNQQLTETVLPKLKERFGFEYSLEGRAAEQRETLADMGRGLMYAFVLIYLVLAWVFSSYGWPFVVMTAIPFGLVGAIAGHWLLGVDLTILSLFGLFGLSGIVVNDAIILVSFYKELKASGMPYQQAIVEAACQRLRAVMLTSLTTIAGLLPLLFETSLQAQFLIPMAVSISFGLAFATLLVLLFIPALLMVHERIHRRFARPSGLAAPET